MYSYTASVFWLLSWPLLIFVAFHITRWVVKKYLPIIDSDEETGQEQEDTEPEPKEA
ncbi:MAG: hypothetical protein K9I29_09855 [Bacteroidales bacterium]|nr:hypothetical protein [Bacteroidales bacterium]MCF8328584.1 hypothetical protein [Bacteroidales bacterium]